MDKLSPIEKEFVKLYQKVGSAQGMDDLFIKIFSITYLSPEEISLEKLSEKTKYSLASISNKVKILETMGILTKMRKAGTKKVFVKAEKNMIKMHKDLMINKQNKGISVIKEKLPEIINQFKNKKLKEEQKKRFKILQDYYKQIIIMEDIMGKISLEFDKALEEYKK